MHCNTFLMKHFSKPRIYEFKKIKLKKIIAVIENKPWIVFISLGILIFILFRSLFGSYFEADEWFHFTYYLPLTRQPDGFLTALVSTIINTGPLSGGQHVSPIATVILFLSTKFFGLNFVPYAFMTLLFHTLNSFLVFLLIKILLYTMKQTTKNIFAFMGAIFFAFALSPIHTVTGAAAFYSYNVLSVTFFLLSVILFKVAFIKGEKKFIYASTIFLFLALFSKETSVFLFALLPLMAIMEKRIFKFRFLAKVFIFCVIVYAIFRFLIPNIYNTPQLIDNWIEGYVSRSYSTVQPPKPTDTGTIVSQDLSIHKNLPGEILFRSITFPIKMTGTLFLPRQTVFSIVEFITPIIQPVPPGGDSADSSQARLGFLYGPGNGFIIYIASLAILFFCASQIFRFARRRQIQEAQTLTIGLTIIVLGALPLVAIIFSFPRWGYDFYFDSRHYYNANVGAAIVFPFLLFALAKFVSKSLRIRKISLVVFALFIVWLINSMYIFNLGIKQFTQNFQPDRREVVSQLKGYLPVLPQKVVFYVETDSLSAYGPILPFQTSVPQALTVVYYDESPLPDSFFNNPLFDGKPEGYFYSQGRGFGYYTSKKTLAKALVAREFKSSDIYAFYYKAQDVQLLDVTSNVRLEMEEYLKEATGSSNWKVFKDSLSNLSFLYPPQTEINEIEDGLSLDNPNFSAKITIFNITPAFDINEYSKIKSQEILGVASSRKVSYDSFHYNDAIVIIGDEEVEYLIKFDGRLVSLKAQNTDQESLIIVEKIMGSAAVSKQ